MYAIDPHELLSTSQVAELLGVPGRLVTDLFYTGGLRNDLCPVIGRRRVVPQFYLPEIAAALKRRGVKVKATNPAVV